MALQTSGAISLNQIHIEAGGSSSTQGSVNDSDIRDLIGKSSGAQASFSEYYGAEAVVPFYGVAGGYVNAGSNKYDLGYCAPGGWYGSGGENLSGWKNVGSLYGDFASKFEGIYIADIDQYGTSEWLILVYKSGQSSAGSGKSHMRIRQSGRPTTDHEMFDNRGVYGNFNSSGSGRLAMFTQMSAANPTGPQGDSIRINYAYNCPPYAFPQLASQGNTNDISIEFI